jgi:hypothetical protein
MKDKNEFRNLISIGSYETKGEMKLENGEIRH